MMKTESISAQNRESLRQLRRRLVREQRAVSIRKFFRNKLSVVGMVLVLLMLICAVFAPLITGLLGVDPYTATMQERFQAPSAAHLFGTDNLGRDIFARVLYGAQISMTVGFTVGLLSALIGTALGLYASVNKVLDNVLMRLCDGLKAIPNILLAITLMAVLGANMKNVIISLTIVSIPGVARIARKGSALFPVPSHRRNRSSPLPGCSFSPGPLLPCGFSAFFLHSRYSVLWCPDSGTVLHKPGKPSFSFHF